MSDGLSEFYSRARNVWEEYQQNGPGRTAPVHFERLDESHRRINLSVEGNPELADALATIVDLAERCCHRPEGLSFVTGEAGLIPRRDLHEKYESALAAIKATIQMHDDNHQGDI